MSSSRTISRVQRSPTASRARVVEAVLFWQLAGAPAVARPLVRSIALLFLAFNLVHALLAAKYFFITPIIPDALIALCLAVAVVGLRG